MSHTLYTQSIILLLLFLKIYLKKTHKYHASFFYVDKNTAESYQTRVLIASKHSDNVH